MAATLDHALDDIKEFPAQSPGDGVVERPAWPAIVLVTPQGWTGRRSWTAAPPRGRSARIRSVLGYDPRTRRAARRVVGQLQSRELFDETGAFRPELSELVHGARRMGDNRTHGGLVLRDLQLPDFRDFAVEVPTPASSQARRPGRWASTLPEVMRPTSTVATFGSSAPTTHLQPSERRYSTHPSRLETQHSFRRRPPVATWRSWRSSASTPSGLGGGLSAHRAARLASPVRGVHPHHRGHRFKPVLPKWLDVCEEIPCDGRWPRLNYLLDLTRVAAGTTTASPIRIPAHSTTLLTKKASVTRCTFPPTPTRSCASPTDAPTQSDRGERHRGGQAAGAPIPGHGLGHPSLQPRNRHLAMASNDQGGEPMWSWPGGRRAHHGKRWLPSTFCGASPRPQVRVVTSWTS